MAGMALPVQVFSDLLACNMMGWSISALFGYDIIITLPQEIALVWYSKWTIPKTLYLFSRYGGFLLTTVMNFEALYISDSMVDCRIFCPSILLANDFLQGACDWLLMIRVTAVFHERRRVCMGLWALFIVVYLAEFVVAGVYFWSWFRVPAASILNTNCSLLSVLLDGGKDVAFSTIPILVLNCVLFLLTLVHLLPYCWNNGWKGTPMLAFLLFQGSGYFAVIFCVYVLQLVCLLTLSARPGLQNIILPWIVAVPPLASNRLLLNLRGLMHAPTNFTRLPTTPAELFNANNGNLQDSWEDEENPDITA